MIIETQDNELIIHPLVSGHIPHHYVDWNFSIRHVSL